MAIQVKEMVLAPPLAATMQNVTGQLAPTSRKTYTIDAKHFAQWMVDQAFLSSRSVEMNWSRIGGIWQSTMRRRPPYGCGGLPDDCWIRRCSVACSHTIPPMTFAALEQVMMKVLTEL
jgi:hypothetical protein